MLDSNLVLTPTSRAQPSFTDQATIVCYCDLKTSFYLLSNKARHLKVLVRRSCPSVSPVNSERFTIRDKRDNILISMPKEKKKVLLHCAHASNADMQMSVMKPAHLPYGYCSTIARDVSSIVALARYKCYSTMASKLI